MRTFSLRRAIKANRVLPFYLFFIFTLALTSCGTRSGYFKIEGRFLHINQGELYVYSPDGGIEGMDTIRIEAGRFAYETKMNKEAILMMVFPNFSEHPVFTEPGGAVDVKADASHLKEMTVKGTAENKLMNQFRKMIISVAPPEEKRLAEQFINDHPDSRVAVYLVRKYFIQTPTPDYKKAFSLLTLIQNEQPNNGFAGYLRTQMESLSHASVGTRLPKFSAKDIHGNQIDYNSLLSGDAIISTWASWSYESMDYQRIIRDARERTDGRLKVVSICVDADPKQCEKNMKSNNINWPNICDGQLLESNLLSQLGLGSIPDNIILKNGKVVARKLNRTMLKEKLDKLQ